MLTLATCMTFVQWTLCTAPFLAMLGYRLGNPTLLSMASSMSDPNVVFGLSGNDDRFEIDPILNSSQYAVNPNDHVIELDDKHEMVSLGYSNITPWRCPRDIPEEELNKKIEALVTQVKNMPNCIFNFHCPPYDTGIDTAPHLDENLKPVFKAGEVEMIPVGSKSTRMAIEKNQPLLGLHGHIHESKGAFKIGRTICLNPGSEYSEGMLRGALVHLNDKGLKNYVLTTG